jgi:phosphate/sulfate permease
MMNDYLFVVVGGIIGLLCMVSVVYLSLVVWHTFMIGAIPLLTVFFGILVAAVIINYKYYLECKSSVCVESQSKEL